MKKILHLFRNSAFTSGFVRAVNKYSNKQEHVFLIYGSGQPEYEYNYLYENNVKYVYKISSELEKPYVKEYFNSFDMIIYNGVFDFCIINFFYNNDYLLKKLYLYFWGGDIPLLDTEDKQLIKKQVIRAAAGILTIIDSDYEKIVNLYHPLGLNRCLYLCNEKQLNLMKKISNPHIENKKGEVFIQLAHSAARTCNHIEVMNILQKFRNENIRIFLPLSYGDKEYAQEVFDYGKKIFGEKIVAIYDYMSIEEYIKFLTQMDIGIFAMERQQALGNVDILGINGCKLFIKKNVPLDSYYVKKLKCKMFYIEDIEHMSFDEFKEITLETKIDNSNKILDELDDIEYMMKKWNELFEL